MEVQPAYREERVSTREFIKQTIDFFQKIGAQWRLLMIGLLIGAIISIIKDILNKEETKYEASVSFNLDIGGSGEGMNNQLSGFANVFGIGNTNQAQTGNLLSGSNFSTLAKSRAVFEKAIMREVEVKGKKMLMGNYLKDSSDIKERLWKGNLFKRPKEFAINYVFTKKDPDTFKPEENEVVSSMFEYFTEKLIFEPVENSSLMKMNFYSTNEILAKEWAETLLHATENFYKEMKTQKTRTLLSFQEDRLDSLRRLMNATDGTMARIAFTNPNVIDPSAQLRQQQSTRNNSFYSTQYYNQLASVENLNRALQEETPIFTVVDPIRLPLKPVGGNMGDSFRIGSIAGFVVFLLFVILRNTYQEIVSSEENEN